MRASLSISLLVLSTTLSGCSTKAPAQKAPDPPKPAAPPPDPRYQKLPQPLDAPDFTPPTVSQSPLSFGGTLWHASVGNLPLVSIHIVFPRGSSTDPAGKEGLTMLAADMLDEGAGTRGALAISDELGRLATDYSASAGVDYVLLSMDTLEDTFDRSVALLADMVQKPQLSKEEFERRRALHVASAQAALADPNSRVSVGLHHVLFGAGYAGSPPAGAVKSLESITHLDLKNQVKSLTVPEGAHFIVTGKIDQAAARATIEKHFARWKGRLAAPKAEPGQPLGGGQVYLIDFPGAPQSALVVATPAGPALDPEFFPELVMNDRIGGAFTGRINMNLREEKGYTYGAYGMFRRYKKAGYYGISTSVISEATVASVQEIQAELASLCQNEPLTESEYEEAVAGLLLGYPGEFATVGAVGFKLASLPIYDRPADYLATWPDNVQAVSLAEARAAAAPYCDPAKYRIVIAGDRAKLTPEFTKLGMTVVQLDLDGWPQK